MVYTLPTIHRVPCEREHPWEKNRTQKPSVMREAANKRANTANGFIRLVVRLVICLAAIGAYYLLVINVIENAPGVT